MNSVISIKGCQKSIMKKLKIRICTFDIAKYGGIVKNVESRVQAFKDMGHDVDIIFLTYNKSIPINS